MEEYEPAVDFAPVVSLALVSVVTGEEDDEKEFGEWAKLYRMDNAQWKERGSGEMKILRNKSSRKYRMLMRREQVLKVCLNHYLHQNMKMVDLISGKNSYCWFAQDFAEAEMKEEQFCVKFKTKEIAVKFKSTFDSCIEKLKNTNSKGEPNISGNVTWLEKVVSESKSSTEAAAQPAKESTVKLSELFKKKEGDWECDACYVKNTAKDLKCLSCESPKPGMPVIIPSSSSSSSSSFTFGSKGGFTFGGQATTSSAFANTFGTSITQPSQGFASTFAATTQSNQGFANTFGTPLNTGFGMSFSSNIQPNTGGFGASFGSSNQPSNIFGTTPSQSPVFGTSAQKTTGFGTFPLGFGVAMPNISTLSVDSKVESSLAPSTSTCIFPSFAPTSNTTTSSLYPIFAPSKSTAKGISLPTTSSSLSITPGPSTTSSSIFQFNKSDSVNKSFFSGFNNAEKKTGVATPTKKNSVIIPQSPGDGMYKNTDGEDDHIFFEPIVILPEHYDMKTGEEDEEVEFCSRAKLYRFLGAEWKERGVGEMKVLRHHISAKTRLLMRREKVLKPCCNHLLSQNMKLAPMPHANKKAWVWYAADSSEDESAVTQFCIKFSSEELANQFKEVFDKAVQRTSKGGKEDKEKDVVSRVKNLSVAGAVHLIFFKIFFAFRFKL